MNEINLETVTRALVRGVGFPDDPFESDEVYFGDAKSGRLTVTWFDTESNGFVTFNVAVSGLEIEDAYIPDYDEDDES